MQHWKLLEQVFTVETIMTPRSELVIWNGTEPLELLWKRADRQRVDIVPVIINDRIESVLYRDNPTSVEVDQESFVPHNLPIPKALEMLNKKAHLPFLLVTFQQTVVGLVNGSDFNKLSARTYFYNLLAELEMEIAERIRSHFQGKQKEILHIIEMESSDDFARKRMQDIRDSIDQMEQDNVEIDIVHLLNLSELVNIVRNTDELRDEFGFSTRKQVRSQLNGLVHLRNDVMHSVKLIVSKDRTLEKLCQQVERARLLVNSWKGSAREY